MDKYCIRSIYDSEKIKTRHFRDKIPLKDLIPQKKYSLDEIIGTKKFSKIELEIACGTGDFISEYAESQPSTFFLAVDYALPAIERAIIKASEKLLNNLIFYCGKIEDFIEHDFKGVLFDKIFINFPDPWPKKKHFKRRIVKAPLVYQLAKIIKDHGEIITATDVKALHENHLEKLESSSKLKNCLKSPFDLPCDAYKTISSYEKKGRKARHSIYYTKHQLKS